MNVAGAVLLIGAAPPDAPRLPFGSRIPRHLLSVADKPWLLHVIEGLRSAGVTRIFCLDAVAPERTRALLDDGTRWGCTITHHAVSDPACRCGAMRNLDVAGPVWVADASEWAVPAAGDATAPLRLVTVAGDPVAWALLDEATLRRIPPALPASALAGWLAQEVPRTAVSASVLRLRDGAALIDAQRAVLEGRHPANIDAAQVEPGVWIARNVRLNPGATVHPPVLLSADSWLQAGSCVGPNAVVGAGAIVGAHCVVADAWLGRATALGDGLELNRACAWSSRVWNVDLDEELDVPDPHLLTTLQTRGVAPALAALASRVAAAAVLAGAVPLLACAAVLLRLRRGRLVHVLRVARLPASGYPERRAERLLGMWAPAPQALAGMRHLVCWTLPGLWHVALGRLRWVGIAPRSWDAVESLPDDLRDVVVDARCGLIDEAWVRYGPAGADAEARQWADVYQAVQREKGYARRLVADYLRCVFTGRHSQEPGRDDKLSTTVR